MQKICIIIPCYNEQNRLPVSQFIKGYENSNYYYLFVNDGSSDQTIEVLKNISNNRSDRISILDMKENKGKAEAVRQGVLSALLWQKFDIIGYLDADLATPIREVDKITKALDKQILFAFGSRVQRVGVNINRKWYRHIMGRVFATFASKMLKMNVYDTQCGAKFFHIDIVKNIFATKFQSNWIFDLEIFFRISQELKNQDINSYAKEIPLDNWADINGSKIKLKHYIKVPFEMLKLYIFFRKKGK